MILRIGWENALDERPGGRGETRNSRFFFYLGNVTIGHFVALGLLILVPSCWHSFFHKKSRDTMPVIFMIDGSQLRSGSSGGGRTSQDGSNLKIPSLQKIRQKIEAKQQKEREKEEKLEKERLEKEKKEQEKAEKIKVSTNLVTLPPNVANNSTPNGKRLTTEEIARMLALSATVGDHNEIPEGDTLYYEIIRRTLYNAWNQPSHDEVGNAVAEVTVKFMPDGRIAGAALTTKTGIANMDSSVMDAVNSLSRIDGLSPDFLKYHNEVKIGFTVKEE